MDGPEGAEALECPLLEHAQDLHLDPWTEVANMLQDEGPLVGVFEPTNVAGWRAREGVPLVAKELAFQTLVPQERRNPRSPWSAPGVDYAYGWPPPIRPSPYRALP